MSLYYRRFVRTFQLIFQMSSSPRMTLEDGPIRCPETSLRKYHSALRQIRYKRRSESSVFSTTVAKEPLGNRVDGIILNTVHCALYTVRQ